MRRRRTGRKITLGRAREQGDTHLLFYCTASGPDVPGSGQCWHSAEAPIGPFIQRFGVGIRLDELPMKCTACGRRDAIDVRGWHEREPPNGRLQDLINKSLDQHRPSNDND